MIHARGLRKVFRRPRRVEGAFGAVRTLLSRRFVETVAVHEVSFDIDEGELIGALYDGTIDRLIAAYGGERQVIVTLAEPGGEIPGGQRLEDGRYRFALGPEQGVPAFLASLGAAHDIRDLTVAEPDLEDVIKRIYSG